MRKLVAPLFITLDGVVEAPEIWSFDHFDNTMAEEMGRMLSQQDAALMGRVTYEDWAGYWPTATDDPFASWINSVPKYVASTTLNTLTPNWENSTLLKGDLATEINKLKALPGKNISTEGSPTLIHSLLQLNLIDELFLTVYPVIAGSGKHLFQDGDPLKRLKLVDSKISETGVAILTYAPR